MNKTTNQYINQLNLDPKREAAVRKLVEGAGGVSDSTPLVENLVGNELIPIKQDGENKAVSVEQIKNEIINNGIIEFPSKYEFVDLGLPSGIKWATCNVGANSPEEAGLYFAWGETEGYEDITDEKQFTWSDYKWCNGTSNSFTKYNYYDGSGIVDDLFQLELIDDAAYISDNSCRMPTKVEFQELIANTTIVLTDNYNGVKGVIVTSNINNNSIFLPATKVLGYENTYGDIKYLSSSLSSSWPEACWNLSIYSSSTIQTSFDYRCYGYPIRPVQSADTPTTINLKEIQDKVDNIETNGDGTKVLSDDGTYKELPAVVTSSTLVITQDSDPATIFNILNSGNYSKIKVEYINGDYTYSGEAIEVVPNESNYSIHFIGSSIHSENEKRNTFGFVFNIVVSASEIELITLYNGSKSSTIYPYHWDGSTINDTIWQELMNARLNSRLVIIGIAQPEVASISYMESGYPSYQCLSTASNTYFINSYWSAETPYYEVIKINKLLKEISAFTSLNTSYYNKIEVTRDKTFDNYTHIEGYTNEYQGELIFGDTVYTVTFPEEVKWSTDSVLEYKPNHTYQFKIVNGLGVMKEFANS